MRNRKMFTRPTNSRRPAMESLENRTLFSTLQVGPTAPYHTISAALLKANPGDTIAVAAGTYTENILVSKANITLVGTGNPTIKAPVNTQPAAMDVASGLTLKGFTISGGTVGIEVAGSSATATIASDVIGGAANGILVTTSARAVITGNTINSFSSVGITVSASATAAIGQAGAGLGNVIDGGAGTNPSSGHLGILLSGSAKTVTIQNNTVKGSVYEDIQLNLASNAGITGNVLLAGASHYGIAVLSGATAAIGAPGAGNGNTISGAVIAANAPYIVHNQGAIDLVSVGPGVKIENNTISNNYDGIILNNADGVTINQGNVISRIVDDGIALINGSASDIISGNTISGSRQYIVTRASNIYQTGNGIIVDQGVNTAATPFTITNNSISDVSETGVYLRGIVGNPTLAAAISGNTVSNVGLEGIWVDDGSDTKNAFTTVSSNKVSNYSKSGIVIDHGAYAVVSGNTVNGTNSLLATIMHNGIEVGNGASALIEGNTVIGTVLNSTVNTASGILLSNSGAFTVVSGNTLTGNDENLVLDNANGALIENNVSTKAIYDGIDLFDDTTGATVTGNMSEDNGFDGIYVEAVPNVSQAVGNTITYNTLKGNGTNTGAPYYYHGFDANDATTGNGTAGTGNTWAHNTIGSQFPGGLL